MCVRECGFISRALKLLNARGLMLLCVGWEDE